MDRSTRKLLQEAGLEKPSIGFKNRVMDVIVAQTEMQSVYRPLISKKSWFMVAVVSIICVAVFYYIPMESGTALESLGISQKMDIDYSLPNLEISKTTMYAIGFMALFLIQIPFLKRYLEKQHG